MGDLYSPLLSCLYNMRADTSQAASCTVFTAQHSLNTPSYKPIRRPITICTLW